MRGRKSVKGRRGKGEKMTGRRRRGGVVGGKRKREKLYEKGTGKDKRNTNVITII